MTMLDLFKSRMASQGAIQSKAYLQNADMVIDKTFTRDPAYREVYITHVPSEIKDQKMDAKFIIDTRRSIKAFYNAIVHYNRKLYNESIRIAGNPLESFYYNVS